jgi:beta-galactosidase
MRAVQRFNDDWLFSPDKLPFDASDDRFEPVTLPHSNREFNRSFVDPADYQFVSTYRKRFRLPASLDGQRVFLDFDGAMASSRVYVNEECVGEHQGGYTPFSFDITGILMPGENVVTVYLDATENPAIPPFGGRVDYLTFGGIYRDVHLRMVDACHIENVFARTANVLSAPELRCDVRLSDTRAGLVLSGVLAGTDGTEIARAVAPAADRALVLEFPSPLDVQLWSPDRPTLYALTLALLDGDTPLDVVTVRVGFREAVFRAGQGFFLNGEHLKLVGHNRHQTYPYIGAAAPARLQRQDADIIKYELGANIVRTAHYPQSPYFMDRCDEIGLLVLEEIPGWQHVGGPDWQALVLRDLQSMIERDRNRPSIVLWGVRINESRDHDALYTRTNALAHQLDPTRQTGGIRDFLSSHFLEDVFTYNDFSNGVVEPPHQPYLITEYGGHAFPTKTWDAEERRLDHALLHAKVQDLQQRRNDVAGALSWCAFDYHTHHEFGSGDGICYHGVMDSFRLPKWAAYFYKSQLSPEQTLVMEPATNWTMGDRARGGNNPLVIFSNCEEIEAYTGEACLGRIRPDAETYPALAHPPFVFRWGADYNPWGQGFEDLRVIGYIGGRVVAQRTIAADHVPCAVTLTPDVTELDADGADMTRLVVRVTDRYNNVLPYAFFAVHFTLHGDARLIGENPLVLVGGQGAVYLKAGQTPGVVTVTATSQQLPPVETTVELVTPVND